MGLELGRLVQQRRHELELSRRDLAERAEVSYPYLSQIETGDRDPSLRTMHKLAEALAVPVEQLAGMVAPDAWASAPASAVMSAPPSRSRSTSTFDDSVELYRDKVLPSIERRLQSVPPLVRLELLAELTRRAAREAAESREGQQ
jgi:transcriptional regulator with XRE-family HTH domain